MAEKIKSSYKSIDEVCYFNTKEINEQIGYRQELLPKMVGWLYPSMLKDEIEKLEEMLEVAKKTRQAYMDI